MAVAANLPKILRGAKVANVITKSIGIKFSVRADGAYNLGKRFIIDNLANQVSSSSMATKRILINLGGNKLKPTITRMYYHDYQMFNTKQVFETTEFMLKHGSKFVK